MIGRLLFSTLLLGAVGCTASATLRARNTIHPVLLGPVLRVGSGEAAAAGQSALFHTVAASNAPEVTDLDVWRATSGQPGDYVRLSSTECGGWVVIIVLPYNGIVGERSTCEASGETRKAVAEAAFSK